MLTFKDTNDVLHIVNPEKVTHAVIHPADKNSHHIRISIYTDANQVTASMVTHPTAEYIRQQLANWESPYA